jgi:hypothetical protein
MSERDLLILIVVLLVPPLPLYLSVPLIALYVIYRGCLWLASRETPVKVQQSPPPPPDTPSPAGYIRGRYVGSSQ